MLTISSSVHQQYPNLPFGIMVMDHVSNPMIHEDLSLQKQLVEASIRQQFSHLDRAALKSLSPLKEYNAFYKLFKKTYHVQLQLESIAFKNKSIQSVTSLVEAMFISEVNNQLLTAGYDFDQLGSALHVELASGNQSFVDISHKEKTPPVNDVILMENTRVIGSILCGPDYDNRITEQTTTVLFAVYGVPGVSSLQIDEHFQNIATNVHIISPQSQILHKIIL
jgi:DNA/RNA-binding domain of Phe-tRNA-synthetase-like protein